MNTTIEKTPTSKAAALSLDFPIYETALRLAKAEGMTVEEWLEKLILSNPDFTDEKFTEQLIAAVSITLPSILRQMVDEVTEAAGRAFEDFQAEYARMIVMHLLAVAHRPKSDPVEDMFGLDETVDGELLAAAQAVAVSYQKRVPAPK